ncbi:hypothetical protein FB45DRAFT_914994 [Roridomyces roridus]|uniref:Uncharacterized protein n=1 Tax=Roridomyces roridus TaxID=1738132 RepID=A0AAD7BT45_9AGAR|nr:hypothetical protein FB45DRAFT_914994 [Roridomyces roridus]
MVDSIFVRSLEVDQDWVFNVYCKPAPGLALDDYLEWVGFVRPLEYETLCGKIVPRLKDEQFFCTGCKASDHPTGLCPLPLTPGWPGPIQAPAARSRFSGRRILRAGREAKARR